MKDYQVGVAVVGVLIVAMLGRAAGHPGSSLTHMDDDQGVKRGFWYKRAPLLHRDQHYDDDDDTDDYPTQALWKHWASPDKRGFGSMMPAYLVHLYRPAQPLLNPAALFTSTRRNSERDKIDYSSQG
ncbi:uncharacterized protein LOC121854447 isoform X2 [Homarus americanus]|uniref:uncharacterized protein LOC121854447 isoform X2 n=1 Tax=Homarus americanus TaxID=6706 RepID=UPI001C45ADBE|nr:uncharacterized protein LOC121854447 isoform X2 [Homarus americanus]